MINLERNNENNSLKVELSEIASTIFKDKLPFKCIFTDFVSGYECWSHILNYGSWVLWNGADKPFDLKIIDNTNKVIFEKKFNFEYLTNLEKIFNVFINMNPNSKGIVIGSHDGSFGHWVLPVKKKMTNCILIEGSQNQFKKLEYNYREFENCTLVNEIITTNGEDVIWFTGGEGFTDSVEKTTLNLFLNEKEIKSEPRKTKCLNELIEYYEYQNFDWLHTDVEGYDDKLIMSLKYFPKLIIFENFHVKRMGNYENLKSFLISKDYEIIDFDLDTLAIRK